MLQFIGSLLLRAALWCMKNPTKVEQAYADAHKLIDEIKVAKAAKA